MKTAICINDEKCKRCGTELPKGTYAWINWYDEIICDECKEDQEEAEGEDGKMD